MLYEVITGTYGLVRSQIAGSAIDYVRYGEEAAALARECGDAALRAAIGTFPAFGHLYAGDGGAMLEWSAQVLEEVGSDNALGKNVVGYSPRAAMVHARTFALLYLVITSYSIHYTKLYECNIGF